MQISKKLYTTLIITVLAISSLAAVIPMASALTTAPLLTSPGTTAEVTSGAVGSKVQVVGNTTSGGAAAFSTVTIYWDNLAGKVLGTTAADSNGDWAVNVTIPSAVNGASHFIVAKDEGTARGAAFTVNSSLLASTDPSTADPFGSPPVSAKVLPGDALTLVGHGYSANSAVTVRFHNATSNVTLTSPAITTNATGSFQAVVIVPSIATADYGVWTVNATDASDVFATSDVLLDYYVTVFPAGGPPGITIMMLGRIPPNQSYILTIDATQVSSGTSGTDGTFSATYETPALIGAGAHDIYVKWSIGVDAYNKSASFNVGSAPTLTLSVAEGVAGAVITIGGSDFSMLAGIELYLDTTLVNSTADDDRFGPTDITGAFTGLEFTVPALTAKVYTLTVVDVYGAKATKTFTIKSAPATTIALRAATYYTGDTLSFNIVTTETDLGTMTVTINDPSGATWWTVSVDTSTATGAWSLTGAVTQRVLYQNQMINSNYLTLPADAPLGAWNWTVGYTPTSTGVATKATELFTVAALPTLQSVMDCCANLTDLLLAVDAKLVAIDDNVATISTAVGDLEVALGDLSGVGTSITSIKDDVISIKTSIGSVETTLDQVDAVVGSIAGDVVTVKTSVGTIEGTITDMDGTLATVETDVGTMKVDVADIKSGRVSVDMLPAWIAVILSLIAALAAIFAVVTIRQKIAG